MKPASVMPQGSQWEKKKCTGEVAAAFCVWDLVATSEELVSIVAGLYPRWVAGVEHE